MDLNVWHVHRAVAAAAADRPAFVWRGKTTTYAGLAERTARLANVFVEHGLGAHRVRSELDGWEAGQDFVGQYLLNGIEYLEGTLAAYGARVAPFNVNYRYVEDELAYLLNDAGAAALVYHARFAPRVAAVLPRLTRRPLLLQVADDSGEAQLDGALDYESTLAAASPEPPALDHTPDDLYVLYTGGTTGMPKGTLWRQADIYLASLGGNEGETIEQIEARAATADSRLLPNAPFMHGAAHWLGLRTLLNGETVVVNDVVDRLDPVEVWSTIARERVNTTLMVGEAFVRPLVEELERGSYDTSALTAVVVGGAVTGPDSKARLLASLPHVLVVDAAGASETGSGLAAVSASGAVTEAGLFTPTEAVRILDETKTRIVEPETDELGWFAKRGRIPLGYLGDQRKTEATFPVVDGVRHSVPGDRARWRADGRVELLGRDSVTINSGGEKIFAEEVEAALLTHPDVQDVIVVGCESERWGQEVVAVVELRPGADPADDDLVAAAAQRIARYKLPKQIVRVDRVLRSPAGKADYGWARTMAAGG